MTRQVSHLIGGEQVGEPERERRNPAEPDDVVARSAVGDRTLAGAAVAAAGDAQPAWASMPGPARGAVLLDAADLLRTRAGGVARDLVLEEGKTLAEARGEVRRAVDVLRFFGSLGWHGAGEHLPSSVPDTYVQTRREPLGVVVAITPWNFPIAIPAWKIAPALVAGNSVVLKPAELTPLSAWHLATALHDAGLPAGVLNVVFGGGALVGDERVAAVSFTGSVAVGDMVRDRAEARRARIQLEMGGKNPLVVLDDADPVAAARIAAVGGFGLTGQACTATSRVLVTPAVKEAFVDALVAQARRYRPGNGLDEGVLMGPVVTEDQLATDRRYLAVAAAEGAEVVCGSAEPEGLFQACGGAVTGVQPWHRIAREEVFGPVVGVLDVDDLDAAIEVANGVPFGLAAGIVTNDLRAAHVFAQRVQAGVVKVNRPTAGLDLNVPFGGVKASSTNTLREQGATAIDFYTWTKTVYLGWNG